MKENLKDLLDQYLTGTISPSDKEELARLMEDPAYEEAMEALLKETFISGEFQGEESPEIQQALHQYLEENICKEKPQTTKIFGIYRLLAAACIVAILCISAWLLLHDHRQNQQVEANVIKAGKTQDVLPGRNGAILTLSNGTKIVLDSSSGSVAIQGKEQVINKKGVLHYEGKG